MSSSLLSNKYTANVGPEQQSFLRRNKVAQSYKGAVFAIEDVWVPCANCRAPVDPVQRIPVGSLWFHPSCLRCTICQLPSRTNVFHAVEQQPVCAECVGRGYGHTVKRSASRSPRREVSITASPTALLGGPLSQQRLTLMSRGSSRQALPPSRGTDMGRDAAGGFSVTKDPRAVTRRGLELLERQEALQRNDGNILLLMASPSPAAPASRGAR
jgi:hypothetical protein